MEIRKAEIEDIKRICEIDTVVPIDSARANYIERVVSANEAWVCTVEGHIVGYVVLNQSFFDRATIDMLMVAPNHRKSGIGTLLLRHMEKICDCDELWTSTNLSNIPMQRLLAQLEYEMTGFINNLDPGDPELILYKRLRKHY